MEWYQVILRFKASSEEEARRLMDSIVGPVCAGEGEDSTTHRCGRKFGAVLQQMKELYFTSDNLSEE